MDRSRYFTLLIEGGYIPLGAFYVFGQFYLDSYMSEIVLPKKDSSSADTISGEKL